MDNHLDRLFLYVMLIFPPFHRFFLDHPEELGLPFRPLHSLAAPMWALVIAVAAAYLGRQFSAVSHGRSRRHLQSSCCWPE